MQRFVGHPLTGRLFDAIRISLPLYPPPFLPSHILQTVHQCLLPFEMAMNHEMNAPLSVKCFVAKLLERCQ